MNRAAPFSPPGWPVVIPRIVAHDAEGLVAFLREVFGATGVYSPHRPAEMKIGSSIILISDTGERQPVTAFLYVYVKDADETYRRALAAGATVIEEPSDQPYGDRRAMVQDRWGNIWQIATHARKSSGAQQIAATDGYPLCVTFFMTKTLLKIFSLAPSSRGCSFSLDLCAFISP